jgi:hypothetical protein
MTKKGYGSALGRDLYVTQLRLSREMALELKEYAARHGLTIQSAIREAVRTLCRS